MPRSRWPGESREAFIERMAGACPRDYVVPELPEIPDDALAPSVDWPQPKPPPFPADDENEATPDE